MIDNENFEYKEVFLKLEDGLKKNFSKHSENDFDEEFKSFKELRYGFKDDESYYNIIIMIPFYSFFKAQTVINKEHIISKHFKEFEKVANYNEAKILEIMSDPEMIKKKNKIEANIYNAKRFVEIKEKYGSIHNFFETYKPNEKNDDWKNLDEFRNAIMSPFFKFLGKVTVNQFLTEIGLDVIKPDQVVQRIFKRLGLINDLNDIETSITHGRNFAKATGLPIRYIDVIFAVYGQKKSYAICLEKNPKCELCPLTGICLEYKQNNGNKK